jgi:hypothetical protein
MRSAIIGGVAVLVLLGGSIMGVAAMLLLPVVGIIAAIALLIWFLQRRASGRPPIR